ncbi:hypothetical protein JTB14_026709 [Gonioctena quinquepunctata]|nr:hypothetical protein JTB14_026709 [Gonioctena quinquepunctata]
MALAILGDDAETAETASGLKEIFTSGDLPACQLQAPPEIRFQKDYDSIDHSSEADVPLSESQEISRLSDKKNEKKSLKKSTSGSKEICLHQK